MLPLKRPGSNVGLTDDRWPFLVLSKEDMIVERSVVLVSITQNGPNEHVLFSPFVREGTGYRIQDTLLSHS